jgi:hypothetical protein
MNETKFKFDKNIPAEILPSIKKNYLALEDLIPTWCHEVFVNYVTDEQDQELRNGSSSAVSINYPYRYANVKVLPCYFEDDETERINTCVHEMVHIITLHLRDYTRRQIERLLSSDDASKYRETVLEGLENCDEAMVCDLTYILQKRLAVG